MAAGLPLSSPEQLVLQVGDRFRAGQAVAGKMRHQVQIERQFLAGELLEQGQHEPAVAGGDEIVGVLDAGKNALQVGQHADRVILEPGRELLGRDGGEDGHRMADYRFSCASRSAAAGSKPRFS